MNLDIGKLKNEAISKGITKGGPGSGPRKSTHPEENRDTSDLDKKTGKYYSIKDSKKKLEGERDTLLKLIKYSRDPDSIGSQEKRLKKVEKEIKEREDQLSTVLKKGDSSSPEVATTKKKIYADVILCNNEGKILWLKRSHRDDFGQGKWCLPGGSVEIGERCDVAACRELEEETGIKAKTSELKELSKLDNPGGSESHYYYLKYNEKDAITLLEEEHDQYRWMTIDEWEMTDTLMDLESRMRLFSKLIAMYGAYDTLKS